MDAFRKQLFVVHKYDHVEPLLSTVKRLQEENERYKKALKHIGRITHEEGVEGCTYGDSRYDSPSAAHGYNECLEHVQSIATDALKSAELNKEETWR